MSLKLHQRPALEAGDPNQFALWLEFVPNLDAGFATPEEDLSWGRFQIWAGGKNLCEHVDRNEVRKAAEWYLLPLLEWLTESWDYLLHEQRPPVWNAGETAWLSLAETNRPERFERAGVWDAAADAAHTRWTSYHSLRACRQGGLFPDVVVRRLRDEVEFSWGETPIAGAPDGFRFLHGSGTARVSPEIVAGPLFEVLRQAVEALAEEQPQSERLQALRKHVAALTNGDRQINRTALLAGLGATPERWLERWQILRRKLETECSGYADSIKQWFEPQAGNNLCVAGSCEAAVMFGAASPTLTESDVLTIATYLVKSSKGRASAKWTALAGEPQALRTGESPWSDGYRLAQEWSARAGIRHQRDGAVDIEEHLERLGVMFADIELDDAKTAGLAVQPEQGVPHIFVNRRNPRCEYPTGRRFILAHELCHLLHDRSHGRSLAIISGPWAPKDLEKRANAFAAALLMPPELLKKGLHADDDLDYQSLLVLAKRLHVSTDALAHHLANCGLISEATRDVLLDQLVNRPTAGNTTRRATRRQSRN
jgi:Zn-dependent peptidase ImmA (M78 family)